MTIKEKRKHIKPYLKYAINKIQKRLDSNSNFLCCIVDNYINENNLSNEIGNYLIERLHAVRPEDSRNYIDFPDIEDDLVWWNFKNDLQLSNEEGNLKRINFCKQQLKIVKV